MQRRDFLKLATLLGVDVMLTHLRKARAAGAGADYQGNFYIHLVARGGWDAASLCDPKPAPVTGYAQDAIKQVGNITYGPYMGPALSVLDPLSQKADTQPYFDRFFNKYANNLLVVSGISVGNNSHLSSMQYQMCGSLTQPLPVFGALVAACADPTQPMAFMSNGGYEETAELIGISRPGSLNISDTQAAAATLAQPGTAFVDSGIYTSQVLPLIRQRLQRVASADPSAHNRARAATLYTLRTAPASFADFNTQLKALPKNPNNPPVIAQAQVALAAFAAGIGISAQLSVDGFDSHSNHDMLHYPLLDTFLRAADYIMEQAAQMGIAERIVLVMGSEFSRTPYYNAFLGKDHWPVGSMMFMGPGIRGNRRVGGTTADVQPCAVDPTTLALQDSGTLILPEHIHAALRSLAGIDAHPLVTPFSLDTAPLPIF